MHRLHIPLSTNEQPLTARARPCAQLSRQLRFRNSLHRKTLSGEFECVENNVKPTHLCCDIVKQIGVS
jgi:hypothetical protein